MLIKPCFVFAIKLTFLLLLLLLLLLSSLAARCLYEINNQNNLLALHHQAQFLQSLCALQLALLLRTLSVLLVCHAVKATLAQIGYSQASTAALLRLLQNASVEWEAYSEASCALSAKV